MIVAGVSTGRMDRHATVAMPGGALEMNWEESTGHVTMTGPATEVFTGEWPTPLDVDAIAAAGPVLRTPRLILRRHRAADADAVRAAVSRFEVSRYTMSIPHPYPPGAEHAFIERTARAFVEGGWQAYAIELAATSQVIGAIGIRAETHYAAVAEVGYHIAVEHWGRGYASEALEALIDHAFTSMPLQKLHARWYTVNGASGRVLEKAGFKPEGVLRQHFGRWDQIFDVACVGLLSEKDWRGRR